jgi:hypothetical protein
VETAVILGVYGGQIEMDRNMAGLLGIPFTERDKRFYLGVRTGYAAHLNTMSGDLKDVRSSRSPAFEAAVQGSIFINKIFAFQGELIYSPRHSVKYPGSEVYWAPADSGAGFASPALMIPILVKLNFYPRNFLISLAGGVNFTIPIGQMEYKNKAYDFSVPPGITAGGSVGIKLGPGNLFADLRYSADFGRISISDNRGTISVYHRQIIAVSLGYELGLVDRR